MGLFTGGILRHANDPRHFWRSLFGAIGNSSFNPGGQPGLVAHYDARVASSITIVTGVSQWNDLSGNGNHLKQATGAKQPTQSGGGLRFTRTSSQMMQTSAFTLNQPETLYIVGQQVAWTSGACLCDGLTLISMVLQEITASPQFNPYCNGSGTNNSGWAVGTNAVITAVYLGSSSLSRVNRIAAVSSNIGVLNAGGFTLGSLQSGGSPSDLLVFEVLIFNVAHSTLQQNQIILALGNKWGIAV